METVVRDFIRDYTSENPGWYVVDDQMTGVRFMDTDEMVDHITGEFEAAHIDDGQLKDVVSEGIDVVFEMIKSDEGTQMSADEAVDPKDEVFAQLSEKLLDYGSTLANHELAKVLLKLATKVLDDYGYTKEDAYRMLREQVVVVTSEYYEEG